MKAIRTCTLIIFATALANAATISSTMTVSASGPFSLTSTSVTLTGTANLTNVGSGTFSATVPVSIDTSGNLTATFTISLSGGSNSLTGAIKIPEAALLSGSTNISAPASITGGSGGYAGAVGSFSLSGSGSFTGTTISVSFSGAGTITTGGTSNPVPTISDVLDAGSYTAGIAQGSIFVVKGTNLSPSGLGSGGVLSFGFPLPTSSNGVSINFTPASGGSPTNAYLVYLYNVSGANQLAAILPSNLASGNYNVTVTNGGVPSAPFAVGVVKSKPEMITQNSRGDGLAIVQNYVSASETDDDLYVNGVINGTSFSPAYPGQTLIAWATGLGPISTGDNMAAPVLDVTSASNVKVIVGGVTITPVFSGRAPGLAGEDQIDFVLPANVPTGCTVSFQISANGVTSAATYIAIAPNSTAGACVQPGFTATQLQAIQNDLFTGGSSAIFTTGAFLLENFSSTETIASLGTVNVTFGIAGGEFLKYTGFQLANYASFASAFAASNSCQVIPLNVTTSTSTSSSSSSPIPTGSATLLDAGAITLTGPGGSGINGLPFMETKNVYSVSISEQIPGVTLPGMTNNGTIIGGQYTLKGAGGKDVGPFTGTVNLGSPLTITGGLPSTVNRSSGLTLNWTGGNSSDLVIIEGLATTTGSTTTASGTTSFETGAEFFCTTTAGTGGLTVPASITSQLPAVNPGTTTAGVTSLSSLLVFSASNPSSGNGIFTAPLTAGGNVTGYFLGYLGLIGTPVYQ